MISYKNITIIGTSHISPQSIREVKEAIQDIHPDMVALELDKRRFEALLSKKRKISLKDIKYFGIKGFFFNLFGAYIENKLGKLTGVSPGSEMKTAIMEARSINSKVALIDQDITITLKKLSKAPFREKFLIFFDSFKNIFKKRKIKFDLKKVPSKKKVNELLNIVKKYPGIYSALISDRNRHMAKNLYKLMNEYNKVVAVVGAGHEEDLIREIKNAYK